LNVHLNRWKLWTYSMFERQKKIRLFSFFIHFTIFGIFVITNQINIENNWTFDNWFAKITLENQLVWNVWELTFWELAESVFPKFWNPCPILLKMTFNKTKLEWLLQTLLKIENCPTLVKTNCNQKTWFKTNKYINIESWKHSYYATNENTKKLTIVT
jgi:hypothetical protein